MREYPLLDRIYLHIEKIYGRNGDISHGIGQKGVPGEGLVNALKLACAADIKPCRAKYQLGLGIIVGIGHRIITHKRGIIGVFQRFIILVTADIQTYIKAVSVFVVGLISFINVIFSVSYSLVVFASLVSEAFKKIWI